MSISILKKKIIRKSKWLSLAEKDIKLFDNKVEKYHSLVIHDYVVVLAKTLSNKIPIVRQYRHAVEEKTWEFPAGLSDKKLSPKDIAIEELREEALLDTNKITKLATTYADPGRLNCKVHLFFAECGEPNKLYKKEDNITVKYINKNQLKKMILNNKIFAMHVSLLSFGRLKNIKWFDDF